MHRKQIVKSVKKKTRLSEARMLALEAIMLKGAGKVPSDRKRRQAQELVYYACEEPISDSEYLDTVLQALELDPGNVDALIMFLDILPSEREDKIPLLRKIVGLAEVKLGPKIFKEEKGHFWSCFETRPYMRARGMLADLLLKTGHFEEAAVESEAMLVLNPNDNQGVRYGLLVCYLALERLEKVRRLFKKYQERKYSAVFAWGYVLERYLAGDKSGAVKELREARKQNPHVEAYLNGKQVLPVEMPNSYSIGSREEAVICADIADCAWQKHPEAVTWLIKQGGGRKTGK